MILIFPHLKAYITTKILSIGKKISNFIEYYIYLNGLKISSVKNPYYNYSSLEHGTYNFQVSGKKYFADSTYLIETYKSKVLKVFH